MIRLILRALGCDDAALYLTRGERVIELEEHVRSLTMLANQEERRADEAERVNERQAKRIAELERQSEAASRLVDELLAARAERDVARAVARSAEDARRDMAERCNAAMAEHAAKTAAAMEACCARGNAEIARLRASLVRAEAGQ